MTTEAEALRLTAIRPALQAFEPIIPWTQAAENLVLGTAAHESGGFAHRVQIGGGPARGLFQMEQATFRDLYDRYLGQHPLLRRKIDALWPSDGSDPWPQVETNDRFAAAMCRLRYWNSAAKIGFDPRDVFEMSRCWSQFYNTRRDPVLEAQFVANYRRSVEDVPADT
jgi:hypothetical protein